MAAPLNPIYDRNNLVLSVYVLNHFLIVSDEAQPEDVLILDSKPSNQLVITVAVGPPQVPKNALAMVVHEFHPPLSGLVFPMNLTVVFEEGQALGKDGNLHLRRPRVMLMPLERFLRSLQRHTRL